MSSTTRAGFLVPDSTDFADETLYYDNNVTVYENELPSPMVATLPSTNYNGQVRTQAVAAFPATPTPAKPYFGRLWNGAWIPFGAAGTRCGNQLYSPGVTNDYVASSGAEVFDAAPLPNFTNVQGVAGGVLKFCFAAHIDLSLTSDASLTGNLNIFLNPGSGAQPNPSTPGAIRLSTPLVEGHNSQLIVQSYCVDHFYGEMFYAPTVTGVIGAAAYLSVTKAGLNGAAVNQPENHAFAASISVDSLQITVETLGTYSG